jgi:hypothetical protein
MRTLIQNYVNGESTEASYVAETLSRIGVEVFPWADGMSAYDKLDTVKPDLVIAHYMFLTRDIIRYLSGKPSISLILNITGVQQHEIESIEDEIISKKINCPFFFTNMSNEANKIRTKTVKLHSIMNGADIFLGLQGSAPKYKIDLAVMSDYSVGSRLSGFKDEAKSWHVISTSPDMESADIVVSLHQAALLYRNYNNVVVTTESGKIPQHFFDAVLYGNKVSFKSKYETQDSVAQEDISQLLGQDNKGWKNKLVNKHTCLNRVDKMLNKLGNADACKSIKKIIKDYVDDYSNIEWL